MNHFAHVCFWLLFRRQPIIPFHLGPSWSTLMIQWIWTIQFVSFLSDFNRIIPEVTSANFSISNTGHESKSLVLFFLLRFRRNWRNWRIPHIKIQRKSHRNDTNRWTALLYGNCWSRRFIIFILIDNSEIMWMIAFEFDLCVCIVCVTANLWTNNEWMSRRHFSYLRNLNDCSFIVFVELPIFHCSFAFVSSTFKWIHIDCYNDMSGKYLHMIRLKRIKIKLMTWWFVFNLSVLNGINLNRWLSYIHRHTHTRTFSRSCSSLRLCFWAEYLFNFIGERYLHGVNECCWS